MTGRFSAQQQSAPATAGNPYRTRAEEDVNSCYILELRRKLYNLLHFLRTIGDLRSTKREFLKRHSLLRIVRNHIRIVVARSLRRF